MYLFLVLVSDRDGLSFYAYDYCICSLLQLTLDQYIDTRNGLSKKDMISLDGTLFQVLDLPSKPVEHSNPELDTPHENGAQGKDPAIIARLIIVCHSSTSTILFLSLAVIETFEEVIPGLKAEIPTALQSADNLLQRIKLIRIS